MTLLLFVKDLLKIENVLTYYGSDITVAVSSSPKQLSSNNLTYPSTFINIKYIDIKNFIMQCSTTELQKVPLVGVFCNSGVMHLT